MNRFIKKLNNKGLTFVEIILTAFILSGAIAGALMLITTSMVSSQYAWDTTVATSHAEQILEEMQIRDSLIDISSTNWGKWLKEQNLQDLPNEEIEVVYNNLEENLLEVDVSISWKRKLRKSNIVLTTHVTK